MTKRIKIPFVKQSPLVPMVRIFLPGGTGGWAIIDTGSESTLLDKEFVKNNKDYFKFKKTQEKINFVGIDSKNSHPIINAIGSIAFYQDELIVFHKLEAIVSDLSNVISHTKQNFDVETSAILGSDFLKENGVEVNFPDKALYMNDDIPCER
jgi:hypothetical protein